MEDTPHQDNRFWIGFFVGGFLGALLLFFFGTKEGKRAGRMIEKKGEALLDDLNEKLEDLKVQGNNLVKKGEELKQEVMERIEEKKDTAVISTAEHLDDALAQIEDLQEQGRKTTQEIRKKIFKNIPRKIA